MQSFTQSSRLLDVGAATNQSKPGPVARKATGGRYAARDRSIAI